MSRIRDGKIFWISGAIVILIVVIGGAFAFFQESEINGAVFTENNIQKMNHIRGLAAYDRHDYATALGIFQPLAQQGDPKAQADVGLMYHDGKGVTQNFAEAIKWYRQAAEAGNSAAQFNLANMYYAGQGTAQNYAEAIKWFGKAAAQGNADATNNLGAIYDSGQGVKQDYAEAAKFYRLAAEQGNISAESNLAFLYFNGQGFRRDYSQAATWYRKAADQGYASAQKALGAMYANGLGITKNDPEAVQWFQKAANQGNAEAQYDLGIMYYTGRGVRQDIPEAKRWWVKSAAQGYTDAKNNLTALPGNQNIAEATQSQNPIPAKNESATALKKAEALLDASGEGFDKMIANDGEAFTILTALSEQGNAQAEADLGTMYEMGEIGRNPGDPYTVPPDYAKALTLLRRAADQGNFIGEQNLALMYQNGQGVPVDYAAAVALYLKAVNQNDPNVASDQIILGKIYEKGGPGVPQDYVQAFKWYDTAAAHKSSIVFLNTGCPLDLSLGNECVAALDRDALAAKMTQAQINSAQKLSHEWKAVQNN